MIVPYLVKLAEVGGAWILWILIGLSIMSTGVIVDRWLFFRRRRVDVLALGGELLKHLRKGDVAAGLRVLEADRSIEASVIARCLPGIDDGPETMVELMGGAMRQERPSLEAGCLFLGTIGNNAPFIGLLGTVLGVVSAFKELGHASAGAMGNVMSGIAEALVATAVGIIVALPAVIAFNIFTSRALRIEENIAQLMSMMLAYQKSRREERRLKTNRAVAEV